MIYYVYFLTKMREKNVKDCIHTTVLFSAMEAHILSTIILTKHQIKALIFQAICLNGLSSQVQV